VEGFAKHPAALGSHSLMLLANADACRYLERNGYNNITVYDVWSQINSPDLRASDLAVLNYTNNEPSGNFADWIEYLQTGQ